MDFTREPIIQSVITPKEGCKLVVRSSKAAGQEEFFVDAVEVVSFGNTFFFRSMERPKSFLVPSNDYEVLEVREARLVLKNVGMERAIKIGGGRKEEKTEEKEAVDPKTEKKRERRRSPRRRKAKTETSPAEEASVAAEEISVEQAPKEESKKGVSSLLPPPSTLISETITRYKDNALFKDAFFSKEEQEGQEEQEEAESEFPLAEISQSEYGTFELTAEEEQEIEEQRLRRQEEEPIQEELPTLDPEEDLINTPTIGEDEKSE